MKKRKVFAAVAAASLITGCMGPVHTMGRRGMAGSTHDEGLLDSAIRVTHSWLIPRTDTLVRRTEGMMNDAGMAAESPTARVEREAGPPMEAIVRELHALATGTRGLVRQMDAMQSAGALPATSGDQQRDMTELHRAAEALVGDLERTVRAADRLRQPHASARP